MRIENSSANMAVGGGQPKQANNNDTVSKDIQRQIANVQKQLQSLSEQKDMSVEEKANRRKELQAQLQDLNQQLRQRQIEVQKEEREKRVKEAEPQARKEKPKEKAGSLKTDDMQSIIKADQDMKQVNTVSNVQNKMSGNAGILESEIKLDEMRGQDASAKKEKLADIESKITELGADIGKRLGSINQDLDKKVEEEKKTEEKEDKKDSNDAVKGDENKENAKIQETDSQAENSGAKTINYTPIDIKL